MSKIKFACGGSYIASPDWTRKKKATVNSKNNNDKYFKYLAIISLNHRKIESHIERASNIKPIINSYN